MARFMVLFAALLLVAGSVVKSEDPTTTTPEAETTTATSPTTTTSTSTTTTTTTTTTTPSTTTTPEETTTTEPPTTTSDTTTTTTESTTTTTTTTETPTTTDITTSSTTSPTTTESPKTDMKFSVTDDNVTCIIVAGEIYFNINYTLIDNTTAVKSILVPSVGVTVDGSCNTTKGSQFISLSWDKNNSVQMNFEIGDKDAWMFTTLTASLYMDEDSFANATDADKTLELIVDYNFSPGEVSVNHSFICRSSLNTNNVTATIGKNAYGPPVTSTLKNFQIQAYNEIKNQENFAQSVHCTADNTSDVVPIAVGCALAGLVVIVLIAYLVGRRKRSGAYQSV